MATMWYKLHFPAPISSTSDDITTSSGHSTTTLERYHHS